MATVSNPLQGHPDGAALRKEAGAYVKGLREKAGITQAQLAKSLGLEYYTLISQIENGKTRVPPDQMLRWAQELDVEPRLFGQRLLQYYDPFMWQLLFGPPPKGSKPRS